MLSIFFLCPLKLHAAELSLPQIQQPQPENEAQQPQQSNDSDSLDSRLLYSLDAKRDYVSGRLIKFASDIDRFFGDDRNYQETNQSIFHLDLTKVNGYGGTSDVILSAKAKLNLPSTENRFRFVMETNPDKNINADPSLGQSTLPDQLIEPTSYAFAARFEKYIEDKWDFSTDAGIKFQSGLTPFTRARVSVSFPFEQWRMKVAESVFWFNTIGAGETTQVDLERLISKPIMFRASSNATWLNDKQNFDLRQDFSIFHTLNERTSLLYQTSVIGVSNPELQTTDFVLLMQYRYQLHRKWIFFEVSPQLHYPKIRNYELSPSLSMRLDFVFDGAK